MLLEFRSIRMNTSKNYRPQNQTWFSKSFIKLTLVIFFLILLTTDLSAKQVTDLLGRKVNLPDKINRIVALAPSLAECLFAIGQGDKVVGVTRFTNYPENTQNLPKVGSYVHLDMEKILALKPDLCLATKDGNPIQVINRLQELGVPVYTLDPRNISSVMDTLVELGQLLQAQDQAEKVVQNMKDRIKRVQEKIARIDKSPDVFFQIGVSPIVSVGSNTVIDQLITMAGGNNLASCPNPYPRFSKEEVLTLSPEVIIVTSMTNKKADISQVMDLWGQFERIPAVKNGRIHTVNSDFFNRASPRLVKGLEILTELLHPQATKAKNPSLPIK